MNKFYDLNNNIEKEQIDISTVRSMTLNNLKLESIKGMMNQKVYEKLVNKKEPVHEEDMELWKSMLRTMCKIDDEDEIKKLIKKLAPYLQSKMRPFLFMGEEESVIRSETTTTINQMMSESKADPITAEKTLEVSVSGDTMQIDETNVTLNIDEDPFSQPESY